MKNEKKSPNYKFRLYMLQIFSFIATSAPLVICFICNWDKYTDTPEKAVKLSIGGILALTFIGLKAAGKLKIPRAIIAYAIVFVMAYLLSAILEDLMLLSGMALLGELLTVIAFKKPIKVAKENLIVGKTATATSAQVEKVFKKYTGRV